MSKTMHLPEQNEACFDQATRVAGGCWTGEIFDYVDRVIKWGEGPSFSLNDVAAALERLFLSSLQITPSTRDLICEELARAEIVSADEFSIFDASVVRDAFRAFVFLAVEAAKPPTSRRTGFWFDDARRSVRILACYCEVLQTIEERCNARVNHGVELRVETQELDRLAA